MIKQTGMAALVAAMCAACASVPDPAAMVQTPSAFAFGASVETIQANLDGLCTSQTLRAINPPQIPGTASHMQIDCEGFDYFGAPRLAELVFGDDKLVLVWVLTREDEDAALVSAFTDAFGAPTVRTETMTAFTDHNAAVRKDVAEVLYYSSAVEALVEERMIGG
jgi:hypothetical protein